jgi:competence protein ComEC
MQCPSRHNIVMAPAEVDDIPDGGTHGYHPLVIAVVAVAAGMVAERACRLPLALCWATAAAALGLWMICWRRHCERLAATALLVAAAAGAASWHHLHWRLYDRNELGRFAGASQPVAVEVVALQRPRRQPAAAPSPLRAFGAETLTTLEVCLVAIRDGRQWRACTGRSLVAVANDWEGIEPGDRLRVFGAMSAPSVPQNPGEFDFAAHARGDRMLGRIRSEYVQCVTPVTFGSPLNPRRWLEATRSLFRQRLQATMPERLMPLARAMLLGEREGMDEELGRAFLATGTIHVLSVSGLHVTILALVFGVVVWYLPLPRWLQTCIFVALIGGYAMLVDARPPVVRATILALTPVVGLLVGRRVLNVNTLAAAGLVVLATNPAELFRPGAQLSFLCVAGLMSMGHLWRRTPPVDPLQRLIEQTETWWPRLRRSVWRKAWTFVAASAGIWALTLPLVLARFNIVSLAALALNVFIAIPVWAAMVGGVGVLLFGWVPLLGSAFQRVAVSGFGWIEWLVGRGAALPGSHYWAPGPADWWLAGFYGGLGLLCALPGLRPPRRWCAALLALWTAVGLGASWSARHRGELECTFISVGHGCAVLVQLPDGRSMLYDAGRLGTPEGAARSIAAVLWSKGLTHLDAVILSHADTDHYNALPELLQKFSVGVVYVSPVMVEADRVMWEGNEAAWQQEQAALTALRAAIERAGVPIRAVHAGQQLAAGPACRVEVLYPPRRGVLGGDNANSVVLCIEHAGRRVLLPGDLDRSGLADLVAEEPRRCDVLLVPHHGSRLSSPRGLAEWASPRTVVISGSRRWDTSAVEQTYEAVGAAVYHTADAGAVAVRLDESGVRVSAFVSR